MSHRKGKPHHPVSRRWDAEVRATQHAKPAQPSLFDDADMVEGVPGAADAPQDRLVPADKVAVMVGRSLRTLSNWETAGVLVPVRVRGRRLYRLSDVLALMEQA